MPIIYMLTSVLFVLGLFILLAISVGEAPRRNDERDKRNSLTSSLLKANSGKKEDAPPSLCGQEEDREYSILARREMSAKELESLTAFAQALADPRCSDR